MRSPLEQNSTSRSRQVASSTSSRSANVVDSADSRKLPSRRKPIAEPHNARTRAVSMPGSASQDSRSCGTRDATAASGDQCERLAKGVWRVRTGRRSGP
jgi:hypothetical protein